MREAIVASEVSVAELIDATLTRIDERDRRLHAFLHVAHESARADARTADAALRAGDEPGPLFGVPVSVKDVFHVAGMPTTAGSLLLGDVAQEDSLHARRLRAAGAIIVGKTNTPEFALFPRTINRLQEETVNPWDPMRSPGGSSGGAAASVAAGMTPLALASDGGGSTRIPAALCGLAGMLPTRGLVPRHGGVGGTVLFSSAGPTTADVRDMATMLQVLAGPFASDPLALTAPAPDLLSDLDEGIRGVRMRWLASTGVAEPPEDLTALVAAAARELGVDAEAPATLPADRWQDPFYAMMGADRYAALGGVAYEDPAARAQLSDYGRSHFERGRAVTGADYSRALELRARVQVHVREAFGEADLLVSPTTAIVAPRTDEPIVRPPLIAYTNFCNYAGVPAATVPCGRLDGLPVGLQFIGRPGADALVLRACRAWERLHPIARP
jgi:Asp-tRNA(Asn)/Glu-tRNA(Gln) amidotransferase A subunit family amidase